MHTHNRTAARLAWARLATADPTLELQTASSDASSRSYWRGFSGGRSLIVMDSPPAQEDPRPWVEIGAQLASVGLHVPAVHAQDLEQGFLLIEDLGTRLYLPELNEHTADALYGDAMHALLHIQTKLDFSALPPYDQAFLLRELEVMPEWFLGRHLGHAPSGAERQILDAAFHILIDSALEQPRRFVHRDFHSRNLLIVESNSPGIIDFQGALAGPIAYDLASLLRDCYIAWDDTRVETWVEGYRLRLRDAQALDDTVSRERFLRWFDLIGLQRHIKVLGQFYRLWYRDGKSAYLADVPRVYRYVVDVARRYPELSDFTALLERHARGLDLTQVADA
jgi:N-acetylmuramate 1-kinase